MRLRATRRAGIGAGARGVLVNTALDWYFAPLGLTGTPWADLTRTGLGTRVDAAGLVQFGPHNLLTTSRVTSSGSFTVTTGVTGPHGASNAERLTAGAANSIRWRTFVPDAGQSVNSSLWIRRVSGAGAVQVVSEGGSAFTAAAIDAEWRRFEAPAFVQTSGTKAVGVRVTTSGDVVEIAVERVSYGPGQLASDDARLDTTTTARYLPRIAHDPVTLGVLGLMVEGQATNEIGQHSLASPQMVTQTITVTAAQRTFSFYGTGTVTLSGAHSATVAGTGAYPSRRTLTFTPSAGSLTLTVSGTVQFPQLETGPAATSYIPNPGTGSAVRVADDWFLSGAALDVALGPGRSVATLYFEILLPLDTALDDRMFYLGNAGTTRRLDLALMSPSQVAVYVDDGVSAAHMTAVGITPGAVNRFAVSFDGSNVRAAVNGVNAGSRASTFGGPTMAERLYVLRQASGADVVYSNAIVRVGRAFPGRAMSIAEMQALTA